MSRRSSATLLRFGSLLGTCVFLAGCSYDYLNHRDTVTLRAGDSIRRNLERETTNPAKASMYRTTGLGKDGYQIPEEPAAPTNTITLTAAPSP